MSCVAGALLAAAISAGAPTSAADMLILKDGRVVQGQKMHRTADGVEIEYQNGRVLVPAALVEDALIEGEVAPAPTAEEQEQAAKGLVRYEGKWIPSKRRDELIQKRLEQKRKEVKEIAEHREWRNRYKETTKHFSFEYTIPTSVYAPLRDQMEAYFTEFTKQWDVTPPKDMKRLIVCLHIDHEAMSQIGGAPPNVLGYFNPQNDWECNFFYDRLDPGRTVHVMFHETNHYLQRLIDVDFRYPHFPGESVAEFYGSAQWDPEKKKLTTGLVLEWRLVQITQDTDAGEWMGLRKLVSTEGLFEHYTWGWSLVHFLMSDPRQAKRFQKFFLALPTSKDVKREVYGDGTKSCTGEEVWRAFCKYMELRDDKAVTALEVQWHDFIRSKLAIVSASGIEQAAASLMTSNPPRPIKAKRLFQEAIDKGSTNPLTYHRFARLLMEDNENDKALALWKQAVELDPLNAEFYAGMGRALSKKGQKDEAKRLRKLAREIDPDDPLLSLSEEDEDEVEEDEPKKPGD